MSFPHPHSGSGPYMPNQQLKRNLPPPVPILIAISYWDGDRELCRQMVDLMVDLEPRHAARTAEVLLVARQDASMDKEMVKKLSSRFNVHTHISKSPFRGWPSGCNGMFASTMQHVCSQQMNVACTYWMEADCTPMYPGWFNDLAAAWAQKKPMTKVMGWVGDCNGNGTGIHITGCAMYERDIARNLPCLMTSCSAPWDYEHRNAVMGVGQSTPLIQNAYKGTNGDIGMCGHGFSLVHGFKDGSLLKVVREKYFPKLVDILTS